ncbi:hypothetical protein VE01_06065 [Pseudogymnoascus verrucosus]|uniref:Mid2 domain-containing protein n=1 Tax=Pseudogymnoascus verrucosus TaxID=342668 RepID=A0A1B8GJ15_9PEZI|nr:uncharacterized protein VE01_06065 [Pseudogymnoascus verrucosus]OBT95821.1 hypothetical protein VE01_06065 [Pseudogymnoascus verrucosus]
MRPAPALASALLLAILPLASAVTVRTCWGYDGKNWENNVLCPGSQACCGVNGMCLPNKLCNSKKDGTGEIIRGPCATQPYDPVECGEICLYDEIDDRFPRVTICEDDGKYCCNNDKDCCAEGRGVILNGAGKVVGKAVSSSSSTTSVPSTMSTSSTSPPETTTSDSSSTSDPTTTSTKPTTPTAASETTALNDAASPSETAAAGGLATGAKIGIGIAVPLGVLAAAGLGAFLWFRRRRVYSASNDGYKPSPQGSPAQELVATDIPRELQAFPKEQSNIPIELPADEAGMQAAKVNYKPYVRGA